MIVEYCEAPILCESAMMLPVKPLAVGECVVAILSDSSRYFSCLSIDSEQEIEVAQTHQQLIGFWKVLNVVTVCPVARAIFGNLECAGLKVIKTAPFPDYLTIGLQLDNDVSSDRFRSSVFQ